MIASRLSCTCCCDPNIVDPPLSKVGHAQVRDVRERLDRDGFFAPIELVITSPLTRAIQTCMGLFEGRNIPIIVTPLLSECMDTSGDIGTPATVLRQSFPSLALDDLPEHWWPSPATDTGAKNRRTSS